MPLNPGDHMREWAARLVLWLLRRAGSHRDAECDFAEDSGILPEPENDIAETDQELHASEAMVESPRAALGTVLGLPKVTAATQNRATLDWTTLIRNAEDGGANSVLACQVLRKTNSLLSDGVRKAEEMIRAAGSARQNASELRSLADEISNISKASRLVAINLSVESHRLGHSGQVFGMIAGEMQKMANSTAELTRVVEKKLQAVSECTQANEELCRNVGRLFSSTSEEIEQFRILMLRVEELSTSQSNRLRELEKAFVS